MRFHSAVDVSHHIGHDSSSHSSQSLQTAHVQTFLSPFSFILSLQYPGHCFTPSHSAVHLLHSSKLKHFSLHGASLSIHHCGQSVGSSTQCVSLCHMISRPFSMQVYVISYPNSHATTHVSPTLSVSHVDP